MSKTKKSSSSLSSKAKKFSRAGLAVLSCIPTPGWGRVSKKALAVSVSRSKVKKTSTKKKNQTNKKTSKKSSALKNLLKRLSQKSRYGRMYTNARKLSIERDKLNKQEKLKLTMLIAVDAFSSGSGSSVQKRPTNDDEMLEAVHKYVYKQYRNSGELARLEERSNDIDRRTGNYSTDFYSQRKVLGNPSSNLKPYIEPEAVNFAVDFFTEDFRTLADRNASFGEKLEAGFFLFFKPAKAVDKVKKVAKAGDEVNDARKSVSRSTGNVPGRSGAFNEAKRDAGIPRAQQPEKVERVPMRSAEYEGGHVIKDSKGNVIMTREYHYTNNRGEKIIIQDHSAGHIKGGQGSHFNVRPADKPRTGKVEGTKEHYPFE